MLEDRLRPAVAALPRRFDFLRDADEAEAATVAIERTADDYTAIAPRSRPA